MVNMLTTLGNVAKFLNESSIIKLQKSIDVFVEKFNEKGKYLPIDLEDCFLTHSKSPTYPNGKYVQESVNPVLLKQEDIEEAKELFELNHTYKRETMIITNYLTGLSMNLILLTDSSPEQLHQLAFAILPEFIFNDVNFLKRCGLENDLISDLQNKSFIYHNIFNSKEEEAKFIQEFQLPEVFELMEKYYALDLLTNF